MCPYKALPGAEVCVTCVFCQFLGTPANDEGESDKFQRTSLRRRPLAQQQGESLVCPAWPGFKITCCSLDCGDSSANKMADILFL